MGLIIICSTILVISAVLTLFINTFIYTTNKRKRIILLVLIFLSIVIIIAEIWGVLVIFDFKLGKNKLN